MLMQNLHVNKGSLPSSVEVPTSKSYGNRALILAALKKSPVTIVHLPEATDVTHLIEAFKAIGLEIKQKGDSLTIMNSFPECEASDKKIETGEGGTTARFLAALLLLGKKKYSLHLGQRLKDRPWKEFLDCSANLKTNATLLEDTLSLQGPVVSLSTLEVDCSRTTQFATAFDLTLAGTKVIPKNLTSSESYWKMNASLKDHLSKNDQYVVPADWSSAAFPMVFAALNHKIKFAGLTRDPLQADSKILDVLAKLGSLREEADSITVVPVRIEQNISFNMSDCLDLFPALSFLLSHISGQHELTGLENLVHKESDRLTEVCCLLKEFGREYEVKDSSLIIRGSKQVSGEKNLELPDDHRIVMTAALFLRHHSGGTLSQAKAVEKSYPHFFDLFR